MLKRLQIAWAVGVWILLAPPSALPISESSGVVIDWLGNWALKDAGLQVGDVLHSWQLYLNGSSDQIRSQGDLSSPFKWRELEIAHAPCGKVRLLGTRGDTPLDVTVDVGYWEADVRPLLSPQLEKVYLTAEADLHAGRIDESFEGWELLVDLLRRQGDSDAEAWVYLRMGAAWQGLDQWDSAVRPIELAVKRSVSPEAHITTLLALVGVQQILGEVNLSIDNALNALEIAKSMKQSPLWTANIMMTLAAMSWDVGDMQGTRNYLHEALDITLTHAPSSLNLATIYTNLGTLASFECFYDNADDYLTRSVAIYERLEPGSPGHADALASLAAIVYERGNLQRSNDLFKCALEIYEKRSPDDLDISASIDHFDSLARVLWHLGLFAEQSGDLKTSRRYYERAYDLEKRLGNHNPGAASGLLNLGYLDRASGKPQLALARFREALAIANDLAPGTLDAADILYGIGEIMQDLRDSEGAYTAYTRSLEIYQRIAPHSLVTAALLGRLAEVSTLFDNPDMAIDYYNQALEIVEQISYRTGGTYSSRAEFNRRHDNIYHYFMLYLLKLGEVERAFHLHERYRVRAFLQAFTERDFAFSGDIPDYLDKERRLLRIDHNILLQRLSLLSAEVDTEEVNAVRQELIGIRRKMDDIQIQLRRISPGLERIQYLEALDAKKVQKALDPGTLFISFDVGEESVVIYALSPSQIHYKKLPIGLADIQSMVARFRAAAQTVPSTSLGLRSGSLRKISRSLYEKLLAPFSRDIETSSRIVIVTDGILHELPFGALLDAGESGEQFLIQKKPIHVALSGTFIEVTKDRRLKDAASPSRSPVIAIFADPAYPADSLSNDLVATLKSSTNRRNLDFCSHTPLNLKIEEGLFAWTRLPHSRREAARIKGLFSEDRTLMFTGDSANETNLKSLGRDVSILHLAAHGYSDSGSPMNSFIALTIPEGLHDKEDNGLLQVWEIFEQVRLDADLVVLSACDTGMGANLGGEGVIGLTRAFQYAGARSVVASLWSVADQSTAEFMVRFYKHLRSGLTKDEALRAAQMEFIQGPIEVTMESGEIVKKDYSSPYYWAAFQLYGDWR